MSDTPKKTDAPAASDIQENDLSAESTDSETVNHQAESSTGQPRYDTEPATEVTADNVAQPDESLLMRAEELVSETAPETVLYGNRKSEPEPEEAQTGEDAPSENSHTSGSDSDVESAHTFGNFPQYSADESENIPGQTEHQAEQLTDQLTDQLAEHTKQEEQADTAEADQSPSRFTADDTIEHESATHEEAPAAPTVSEKIFNLFAWVPMLTLLLIVAAQTVFMLDARELWFSDEIRYANVFEHLNDMGKWIVLYLNGIPYPDKPPVYFWLLKGLHMIVQDTSPMLFFLGAAVSGLFFTWSTYLLARACGEDKRTGLAAGLIIVSTFFTIGMMHYSRMDLLFATFITLSHICLLKGWHSKRAMGWVITGFLLAGLATLTKGPLGLAFPVLSIILFTLWRCKLRRLGEWDVAIGFALMVIMLLAWVTAAYITEDPAYLRNILNDQIIKRATDTWHHGQPWWFYFGVFPAIMLPWALTLFILPYGKLFTKQFYKNAWATRQPERMGTAYLWITVLSGFILLSAVSIKLPVYLLPLVPPLAVLLARGLRNITAGRSALLFRAFGLLFAAIAGGLVYITFFNNPFHVTIEGWYYLAGLAAIFALVLWRFPQRSAFGGIFLLTVLMTVFIQPLGKIAAPSLDSIMSPKEQATLMREYTNKGFAAGSYRIYSGTYSYYAKQNIFETNDWDEINSFVDEHPNVVVAIRQKHWDEWENRPEGLEVVHRQMLVDPKPRNAYLLAVRNVTPVLASPPEIANKTNGTIEPADPADTVDSEVMNSDNAAPASPEASSLEDTIGTPPESKPNEAAPENAPSPDKAEDAANGETSSLHPPIAVGSAISCTVQKSE